MKKILIVAIVIVLSSLNLFEVSADSENNDNKQKVVLEVVGHTICREDPQCDLLDEIKLKKETVYTIELEKYGYLYSFETKDESVIGFVLLKEHKDDSSMKYSITEISTGVLTPYLDDKGKNIYLGFGYYAELKDGVLSDVNGNYMLFYDDELVSDLSAFYSGAMGEDTYEEGGQTYYDDEDLYQSISYTYGYVSQYGFPDLSTQLGPYPTYTNNCSPTAGTELIVYFSQEKTGLRYLNSQYYNPLKYVGPIGSLPGFYTFKNYSDIDGTTDENYLMDLHDDLYVIMDTENWTLFGIDMPGTKPQNFYDGLSEYLSTNGYVLNYKSLHGSPGVIASLGGSMEWNEFKTEIDLGRPVVMQMGIELPTGYAMIHDYWTDITYGSGDILNPYSVTFKYAVESEAHTVVAYGYETFDMEYSFFLNNHERFAIVANGWGGQSYINVQEQGISMAYSLYLTNKPEIELSNIREYTSSIFFDVDYSDYHDIIDYNNSSIELYKNGVKISEMSLPVSGSRKYFNGLDDDTNYEIVVIIEYFEGDGTELGNFEEAYDVKTKLYVPPC